MYVEVIKVNKPENKHFIGNVYKVKGEKKDVSNKDCYVFFNTKKIFEKKHCIVLENVLEFNRGKRNVQKKKKRLQNLSRV